MFLNKSVHFSSKYDMIISRLEKEYLQMKTIQQELPDFELTYPLTRIAPLDKILFVDIETTGFTAKSSTLYLIGCAWYNGSNWIITQWLATTYEEEKEILEAFFNFAASYTHLIHFNGNHFDLPFMLQKSIQYDLECDFTSYEGIDLYKRISPYKLFLRLPNCKQKTLEQFLGINRIDTFNGGELIGIYHDYVSIPSDVSERLLLQHNADDMRGMLSILPMLAYYDLFNREVRVKKVQANHYKNVNGLQSQELLMSLELPTVLPNAVSGSFEGCYFSATGSEGLFKIPLYEEELKYFYSNYKDYYYLPAEDIALHKSVASFVDKNHRTQATAATCYTRKLSTYLPQWEIVVEPFFKRDYKSKVYFFEVTEELKKDRNIFTAYAKHLLDMLGTC